MFQCVKWELTECLRTLNLPESALPFKVLSILVVGIYMYDIRWGTNIEWTYFSSVLSAILYQLCISHSLMKPQEEPIVFKNFQLFKNPGQSSLA